MPTYIAEFERKHDELAAKPYVTTYSWKEMRHARYNNAAAEKNKFQGDKSGERHVDNVTIKTTDLADWVTHFKNLNRQDSLERRGLVEVVRPVNTPNDALLPCIFFLHGGAFVGSNRFVGLGNSLRWAAQPSCVTISLEYGLAPECNGMDQVLDCYNALKYIYDRGDDFGIDRNRIVVYGASAGGCLAAGVALKARDDARVNILGLCLEAPALDDTNSTASAKKYVNGHFYGSLQNRAAWEARHCNGNASDNASPYVVPAREKWLGGLPPTYVFCGTAEPFYDEIAQFVTRLQAASVTTTFNKYDGVPHGFFAILPEATVSITAVAECDEWIKIMLSSSE